MMGAYAGAKKKKDQKKNRAIVCVCACSGRSGESKIGKGGKGITKRNGLHQVE
jgi:hypothetical protein